jgi:hypothetical protein
VLWLLFVFSLTLAPWHGTWGRPCWWVRRPPSSRPS